MRKFVPLFLILFYIVNAVHAQCNPAFTASVNQATAQFQAAATNSNLTHSWSAGDGSYLYGINVSHNYTLPGTYTVTHYVVDSLTSCKDSAKQTIVVNFPVSCLASFNSVMDSVILNQYHFTSTSSAVGSFIQSYKWTVNGVIKSSSEKLDYTFLQGTYDLCLTITTVSGCTSSSCKTVTVGNTNCNWTASFTSNSITSTSKTVGFSPSPDADHMRYQWYFGDEQQSSQKKPVHSYQQAGVYSVKLIITDTISGCYDTVRQTIQVYGSAADSCTAVYSYTVNPSLSNQLTFTATSNQNIISQQWYITSQDSSYTQVLSSINPVHTFIDTGYYSVCLKIVTTSGCQKWYCNGIAINNLGKASRNLIPSFPNPVTGTVVKLPLQLNKPTPIKVTVYNRNGIAVYVMELNGNSGNNIIAIPVGTLQNGQYFVALQYEGERKQSVFQKL
jgi:PKD repeat protein